MKWGVLIPLAVFLAVIFMIGFWASKYVAKTGSFIQEYFIASRDLGGFVLAMTMIATYASASSFIGGPGVAYTEGLGWVLLSMAQLPAGYFVLMILGKKFAIMARKYNAVTLVDFLKEHYRSKWVAVLSALSIIVFLFSAMAAQWVGGGIIIESLTGLSYSAALLVFALSVMVYVVIGGFRAVVVTDAVQGTVMFIGTLILLIATISAGGGIDKIIADLYAEDPGLISPFGIDGTLTPLYVSSFWILVGVGVVGLPQISVRAMSYKSSKAMHRAIIIGTIVVGFIMLGMHLIGVFARPILPGIEHGDKVMPTLALTVLPSWLAGIVLSAPMAAIMSTVDSMLILVSSAVVKDIYLNFMKPDAGNATVKKFSLIVTTIIGVLVFFLALDPPDLIIWLNLFSFGGLEATFIWPVVLGLYWKRGNKYGAILSMITGIVSYIFIHVYFPNPFGAHTVVLPVLFSLIAYVSGSLLVKTRQNGAVKAF